MLCSAGVFTAEEDFLLLLLSDPLLPPGLPPSFPLSLHLYACWWRISVVSLHIKPSCHISAALNNRFSLFVLERGKDEGIEKDENTKSRRKRNVQYVNMIHFHYLTDPFIVAKSQDKCWIWRVNVWLKPQSCSCSLHNHKKGGGKLIKWSFDLFMAPKWKINHLVQSFQCEVFDLCLISVIWAKKDILRVG